MPGSYRAPLVSLLLPVVLLLPGCGGGGGAAANLHFYVGGTMRPAVEEIVRLYEAETGRRVDLDYGDSGACAIKVEGTGQGDLIVVHDPFHEVLAKKGLLLEGRAVASLEPAIAVAKGNPKGIGGLKDLTRPGLRVILTDRLYSTAGSILEVMARKAGIVDALEKNVVSRTRTGGEAANAVVIGTADATVAWGAVIRLRADKLDAIPIEPAFRPDPKTDPVIAEGVGPIDPAMVRVTVDILRSSRKVDEARALVLFLASDRAAEVWRRFGFGPPPEEKVLLQPAAGIGAAAESPGKGPILVLCGAGLRPPIEEISAAFTAKTGIAVERDYAGSGVILSRLRLSKVGEVFIPGDAWYVDLAEKEGLVAARAPACRLIPVILVPKGNPKKIAAIEDLARPGLRIGLGNSEACQIGRASDAILARAGVDAAAVRKNQVFSSVTVGELGIQIQTGGLDATIVWDAVAAQYKESAEAVPIPPEKNDVSRVEVAVLKSSRDPAAAEAFLRFATGAEGRAVFGKHGYAAGAADR